METLPVPSNPKLKVVDENGKEIVRPDVIQAVMQFAQVAQLTRIRKSLEKQDLKGELDPRDIGATEKKQFLDLITDRPYQPWINAFFVNDGPDTVYLFINRIKDTPHTLKTGETLTLDHSHASERISQIFYYCDAGETASVRVTGQY